MDQKDQSLNDEGRQMWDQKAAFWDQLHGERGNRFHQELVSPSVEELLALHPGERVLDIACGTGVMARRLAELGAIVTATDFSPALIDVAKGRGQSTGEPIHYTVADATDEEALAALGEGAFDAVTCTMALMDMPVIAPLYRAVKRLLNPQGRFVFATSHPAFNSNDPIFFAELEDRDGQLMTHRGVKIRGYADIPPVKGAGAKDEPTAHYYYHRPLHDLLGQAFDVGFILDGISEPTFQTKEEGKHPDALSWVNMPQIPPVFTARLRPFSA